MKVRMTFDLSDEQRLALARRLGCKRPATRAQVIQAITTLHVNHTTECVRDYRLSRLNLDPNQATIPGILED